VVDGLVIEVLGGHHRLDDVLHQLLRDVIVGDVRRVLGGDEDGVHALGHHGAALVDVLAGHLGLAVGAHPRAGAVLADLGELVADAVGQVEGERHEGGGLVRGVAEHDTLVTGADLLERLGAHAVHALANLGRLAVELHQHAAGVAVKADVLGDEADVAAHLAHNRLVVHHSLGGDLAEHHHHAGLGGGLARDLRVGVLGEARIEDRVGDLVRELVGVALVDRLGGEQESVGRHF